VRDVARDAAGVPEQLADGDRLGVGQQAGQVVGDRVVEPDPPLADELEDHGGDERLGHAGDPDPAPRVGCSPGTQVTDAGRTTPGVTVLDDGRIGAGHAAGHHVGERVAHG